jgi:hypothetical protein
MQKTLVIIISETRAHELTFDNFKQNVIDELEADLCICIGVKADYDYENPFYKLAKYRFLYNEQTDTSFAKSVQYSYDETQNKQQYENGIPAKHYTEFLKIKSHIGCDNIENDDSTHFSNFVVSTYIHIFFLWFLQKNMRENDLISKYDRFLILRSDYMYVLPFPKMNILDEHFVWIPDWEDYGGLCDRAVVLSKQHFDKYVRILECFYTKSNHYYSIMESRWEWNMERILRMHLEEEDLFWSVRRYPYISYAIRNINGTTRWSEGTFSGKFGYYIKYNGEYDRAIYYKHKYDESNMSIDEFYQRNLNNL